jgi:hypothetical protein
MRETHSGSSYPWFVIFPPPPLNIEPPRRNLWRFIVPLVLLNILVIAGLGTWWYRYTGTPECSLARLGHAVRAKNYGEASQYVDEERIANAISQSLTDVLLAKYTQKFKDDPLPFTDTRIELLHKIAPRFHDWSLLGVRNAIRLLLSGNGLLTGSTGFKVLDEHNFSGLHPVRSTVSGDIADVVIVGLPQPNPFDLNEIHVRMVRIPNSRQWRIEEIPDATPIFARYFNAPVPPVQP